jgi:hypothetical protein
MRLRSLSLLLVLSACSRTQATPLTQTDWTNGQQPCSENRLSFRGDQIAYYPKGSQPLVMFKVVSMRTDTADRSLTAVVVEPTQAIRDAAERQGLVTPSGPMATFFFRVTGNRLSLAEEARPDGSDRRSPPSTTSQYYDLLRCRS